MEGKRSEKVADLIQKEISQMLVKSIKDPRIGFVTITKVTVSEDCRFAKIYFSVAGTEAERENSMRGLDRNWVDGSGCGILLR
jgi:ribosome-binding factor A